jgi:DNA polymerase III delta subunit
MTGGRRGVTRRYARLVQQIVVVTGPRGSGPGERELMFEAAHEAFERWGIGDITRIDVPGRASGEESDESGVRAPVAAAIPALQSGSLFGGATGVLIVDADQLQKAEAEVLAEVIPAIGDDGSIGVILLTAGALPSSLDRSLKQRAEQVAVRALTERTAVTWLAAAARKRMVRLGEGASAALIRRFGTDVASLGRALDQLAVDGGTVTATTVTERFRNRPDEPMWHYTDAVAAGRTGEALRRLSDFLLHGHPLQLLAYLQSDLRRRAIAASAPDYAAFLELSGSSDTKASERVWQAGRRARPDDLRKALAALARADLQLKTAPEPTHRVTLERLTVALSYWYA